MQIDAVILDYGHVLGLPPREDDFEALRKLSGLDGQVFRNAFWQYRDAYDRGAFDGPAYWQRIASDAGTSFSPEQIGKLMARDNQLWVHPHPVILEWARLLSRHGVKTAVLSNMPRDLATHLRQTAKWLEPFTYLCFSGELKLGKPDAAIFRFCLEALGVPAPQALFIDDREGHVAGARAVRLQGVVFRSVEQLRADLEPFGLAASLAEAAARVG
jgi:putative hydrolase of the HAD superfamily